MDREKQLEWQCNRLADLTDELISRVQETAEFYEINPVVFLADSITAYSTAVNRKIEAIILQTKIDELQTEFDEVLSKTEGGE